MFKVESGTPTGCYDSNGVEIKVGDILRQAVTINDDRHGPYALYQVECRGLVPVITYLRSARGRVLPEGYSGQTLSNLYDGKMFMFANDRQICRPELETTILTEEEKEVYQAQLKHEVELKEQMIQQANELLAEGRLTIQEICSAVYNINDGSDIRWERQQILDAWKKEHEPK